MRAVYGAHWTGNSKKSPHFAGASGIGPSLRILGEVRNPPEMRSHAMVIEV